MSGDGNDEDAAWRDLVARFSATASPGDGAAAPWPAVEELPSVPQESSRGGGDALRSPGTTGPADSGEPAMDDPDETDTLDGMPPTDAGPVPGVIPALPQIRVIRPAAPVPPPAEGEDEHYVPPPPPPLPPLDPLSKGAWAAIFGGPGYLLVAAILGWVIPGWAALCAVGAFVGGFATIVARMGDRPPGDSGPDNGAVV